MDAEAWAGIGTGLVALLGGVWAAIATKRKRAAKAGGSPFKPRARFRAYLSLRTHDSAPPIDVDVEIIPPPHPMAKPPRFPELEREPPDPENEPTNPKGRK